MKRQYFTLTEMLVVMAIIMILAGLVFPAVSSSRTTAKAAACTSNQKQVITGIIQSMNANKNHFYSPSYTGLNNGADDDKVRWSARLYNRKYLPDYQVMRCPEALFPPADWDNFRHEDEGDDKKRNDDAFTYGAIHADTSDPRGLDFRGTKLLKLPADPTYDNPASGNKEVFPSQLMFGGCSWNIETKSGGALLDFSRKNDDRDKFMDAPYGKLYFAHRGNVNLFFYDGHVAAVAGEKEITKSGVALGGFNKPYYYFIDKDTQKCEALDSQVYGAWK